MFRKRTLALRSLVEDLKRPRRLLLIERQNFSDPPRTTAQQIGIEGLRGGAIVLMTATFEVYLKDVFLEVVQALEDRRSASKPVSLSAEFILANDFEGVEAIVRDRFGDRTSRHADLRRVARAVAQGELVGDGFARTDSNPKAEVVAKMMKRFGVDRPFDTLAAKAAAEGKVYSAVYLRTKLDEILNRRNEVAHEGVALHVTRLQLNEYVDFVRDLGALIDGSLIAHYKKLCK